MRLVDDLLGIGRAIRLGFVIVLACWLSLFQGRDCRGQGPVGEDRAIENRTAPDRRGDAEQEGAISILAWRGPPAKETTPERFEELAKAGFTHALTPYPDADAADRALALAERFGIRLFISCPELDSDPEGLATRFRGRAGLAGYDLRDEPSAPHFAELAGHAKRLRAIDTSSITYINLLPTYASAGQLGTATYAEYVDRFLAEVPTGILSFDHYPITFDGLRGDYFENLEIVSRAAKRKGVPMWAFVMSVAHDPYPVPTAEQLQFQAFCNLAYGAKCIQYFTYWTPFPGQWNFHQGPIETDGSRTPTYELVKTLNRRIRELSPIFGGSEVIAVGHLGEPLPAGTKAYEAHEQLPAVRVANGGVVLSHLRGAKKDYLVAVNRSYRDACEIVVRPRANRAVDDVTVPNRPRKLTPDRDEPFTIAAGEIAIIGWSRDEAADR